MNRGTENLVVVVVLPQWLFDDLCKIQAAKGIPLETILKLQLEQFVVDNWDFENDKPRKEIAK